MPEVMDALASQRREYAEANALVVTPAMMKLERFQRPVLDEDGFATTEPLFSQADFDASGGSIRLPVEPTTQEQALAVFPIVFDAAEDALVELLALLVAPNSELADADEEGTVDDYLKKSSRKLLHAASLAQLMEIIVAAIEIVTESLMGDGESPLGKVVEAMTSQSLNETQSSTQESATESPETTVGTGEQSSTKPNGQNSKSLSSA